MNRREPLPNMAAQPAPREARLALTVEQILVTGLDLSPLETQRFTALLIAELQQRLVAQFALSAQEINAEPLRFDLGALVLTLDQPGDASEAARTIARRLALTLASAAQKGAV